MNGDIQINLIAEIDSLLPQTQCTRCGYPSCLDYAKAIANKEAEINQCPPGGNDGIKKLAKLLHKPIMALNPLNGSIKSLQVAVIDEDICIGCTLCIKACPVDAILGSNKMMHTVIEKECTGCDLCIPACPVDCITMIEDPNQNWTKDRQAKSKLRFNNRNERQSQQKQQREARLAEMTLNK